MHEISLLYFGQKTSNNKIKNLLNNLKAQEIKEEIITYGDEDYWNNYSMQFKFKVSETINKNQIINYLYQNGIKNFFA